MIIESGSSPKRIATERSPESIQEKSCCMKTRSSGATFDKEKKHPTAIRNARPTVPVPIALTSWRGSFPAPAPFTIAPTSGSTGINQRSGRKFTLAFQEVDVVHARRLTVAENGDQDCEADRHLGRRHRHHEEHEDVSFHAAMLPGEGEQGEIHGIQHQLDGHENDQGAPPHQDAHHPDREQDRGEELIPEKGHRRHRVHQKNFLFASTTAPTTATRSRIETISK